MIVIMAEHALKEKIVMRLRKYLEESLCSTAKVIPQESIVLLMKDMQ